MEPLEDCTNGLSQSFTFGSSNEDVVEFVELGDGLGQVQDVVTTFKEIVQSDEQSVCGQLPLVLSLSFVLEISVLEFGADVDGALEFLGSGSWGLLKKLEDHCSGNVDPGRLDDGVTNFTDQHDKSGWRVIVLGVFPDEQDGVHDWHKQEMKLGKVICVHQLHEPFFENSNKGVTVISFDLGLFNLLFKLFEWLVVSRFGLQKEF